jgi:hypothetical protein
MLNALGALSWLLAIIIFAGGVFFALGCVVQTLFPDKEKPTWSPPSDGWSDDWTACHVAGFLLAGGIGLFLLGYLISLVAE